MGCWGHCVLRVKARTVETRHSVCHQKFRVGGSCQTEGGRESSSVPTVKILWDMGGFFLAEGGPSPAPCLLLGSQTPLSRSGYSRPLTKPGKIWCQSRPRGRPCSESRLPRKEVQSTAVRNFFPSPFLGGTCTWRPLETFWLPAPHLFLAVRKQGRVRIGEKGAGAGTPPAAGQRNWPAGPGKLAQSEAWGGF